MPSVRHRRVARARRIPRSAFVLASQIIGGALAGCTDENPLASSPAARPPLAPSLAAASLRSGADVIPGQYIVVFRDSVKNAPELARRLASEYAGEIRFTYTSALKGFAARLPEQAVAALERNPTVAAVEQDAVVREAGVDSPVGSWGLDRIDQRSLPLSDSYGYANSGEGVQVYILDTGIRTTHQEFGGRAVGGYTAINDGYGTSDCRGHGTHVAGTVGGTRYGVAKRAALYSVRVLDCSGYGTTSGFVAGVDWITRNAVLPAVANMSLSGSKSFTLNSAVQGSIKAGIVYVVAAGNNGADACSYSPASTPEALTVGSSWNGDGMSAFSNIGSCVDLFAPGETIRSAYFVDDTSSILRGGTSMATPHVTGVAALYLAANPSATPAQVAAAIVGGATPNALSSIPSGTPNLLLYSSLTSGGTQPPDTVTPPLPVPPDTTTAPDTGSSPAPPAVDHPPTASFRVSCARSRCSFDPSTSSDDRGIATYTWNFGDGSGEPTSSSPTKVSHVYPSTGSYTVTLTVTDIVGQGSTKSAVVTMKKR